MTNKFCLVLGASGEIGRAICQKLAKEGWSLYLQYNQNQSVVSELVHSLTIEFHAQEFICIQADFTQKEAADELVQSIFSIEAIVVASGQAHYQLLEDVSLDEMDQLWKVHVQNPIRLISLLSPKLRRNGHGQIVFIGSIWGETGAAGETVYSTVKGAQHAFVKSYAKEIASSKINVNAIAPGLIETSMNQHLTAEEKAELFDEIPLGRAGKPEEVAEMVHFLLSGRANYMTGQILRINGGWYI